MIEVSSSTILVVAAHPDDEVLGCGGSINKWTEAGAEVHALILAEGLTSRAMQRNDIPQSQIADLREAAKRAANIIGYRSISFESFPDNRMDSVDLLDIIHVLSQYIEKKRPNIILTHHYGDLNIDHRICFQAVITACRPLPDCPVQTIMSYETPSATEWGFPYSKNVFSPNIFVDISGHMETKLEAMNCYRTEIRKMPHPRAQESLCAIAQRWGSVAGYHYAEPFELVRTSL